MMKLYEKVKALADTKGMTIAALEKQAGIANGTIGKWRDDRDVKMSTITEIAKVLGVSIADLVEG